MGLPPVTPTPSRFLINRKTNTSTQQTHQPYQTPAFQRQHGSSAPRQFFTTPRFSSSKPPPSSEKVTYGPAGAATTPVLLNPKTPRSGWSDQDIIDSSPDSPENLTRALPARLSPELPEPIELPSSLVPGSSCPSSPRLEAERPTKRRRISIPSSEPDSIPRSVLKDEPDDIDLIPASSFIDDEATITRTLDEDEGIFDIRDDEERQQDPSYYSSDEEALERYRLLGKKGADLVPERDQKPKFLYPPSFKPLGPSDAPAENSVLPADHLADIFSPLKRKGAKYIPGGLAAELRDWLVDVKTESDKRLLPTGVAKLEVGSVRNGGRGLTLISGRPTSFAATVPGSEAPEFRTVLVGEGGLGNEDQAGLDGSRDKKAKNIVSTGKVVGVAPPAWDVDLPGQGRWSVAYRWELMDDCHGKPSE
ncbi:hypothetical protein V8F20_007019 [Naviculisporaceae sp. PSN 640]